MKEQDWINAGYSRYGCKHLKPHADFLLQKRIYGDGSKTLYMLNVFTYDWEKPEWVALGVSARGVTFFYEVSLFKQDGEEFRVSGEVNDGVDSFEAWINHLYFTLNCIPDVHDNKPHEIKILPMHN